MIYYNIFITTLVILLYTIVLLFYFKKYKEHSFIYISSRNIKNKILTDDQNILQDCTQYDFTSLQQIRVPNTRWKDPHPGSLEVFDPQINKQGMYLILNSAAEVVMDSIKHQHSFGCYINPNGGFQYSSFEFVPLPEEHKEKKGIILINGKYNNKHDIIIGVIHGAWDNKSRFRNNNNIRMVTDALTRIKCRNKNFIIFGDFNLSYECMMENLSSWRKLIPKIKMEDGPFLSCIDSDEFSTPDHILTDLEIEDIIFYYKDSDHLFFDAKIKVPYKIKRNKLSQIVIPEKK